MSKVSTCLWFGKDAEMAVRFYVSLVPGSSLKHILRSPGIWPGGEAGDVILVTFTLGGQSFQALNGGAPASLRNCRLNLGRVRRPGGGRSAVDGTHRRWRLGNHVRLATRQVGRALANRTRDSAASPGRPRPDRLGRVFAAMTKMVKLDIAALERAAAG